MKKSWSISDMAQAFNEVFSPASMVSVTANSLSNVLSTTKGREKFLALIQYLADLYKESMRAYLLEKPSDDIPVSLKNAKSIERSMRNGRKLFRVLMFVDEYANIEKTLQTVDGWPWDKVVKILSHCASFVYFILDNLVWAADIGIINKLIYNANIKWKSTKDLASLWKVIFELILSFHYMSQTKLKIQLISTQLANISSNILSKGSRAAELLSNLVHTRSDMRFRRIDVAMNSLRFSMLVKALKLPGHHIMSNVFTSICGITTSLLSMLKMLTQKPRIITVNPKQSS